MTRECLEHCLSSVHELRLTYFPYGMNLYPIRPQDTQELTEDYAYLLQAPRFLPDCGAVVYAPSLFEASPSACLILISAVAAFFS